MMNKSLVEVGAELMTKDEALDRLIELQTISGDIRDALALSREVRRREARGSGAVSMRIAVTEINHKGSSDTTVSALTVKKGVDCGAPDRRPVKLLFLISGKDGTDEADRVKNRLLRMLSDMRFTSMLCAAKSREEFLRLIEERERRLRDTDEGSTLQ